MARRALAIRSLIESLFNLLGVGQALLGVRVAARLAERPGAPPLRRVGDEAVAPRTVSVIVPVLDEQDRLGPCLDGLIGQGASVGEILVVDGGSADGTAALVRSYGERDPRLRLVEASPVPSDWNGKAWGLQVGSRAANPRSHWLVTVDADVRPPPRLVSTLVAHASRAGLASLSVATRQQLSGAPEALVHPAMLATLVYRVGRPGRRARSVQDVQANGQCALYRRDALARVAGFRGVRVSRCEDLTLARLLVAAGHAVGFVETEDPVVVEMFDGWRSAWDNWPRSLTLRDHLTRWASLVSLAEVTLVQALPWLIVPYLLWARRSRVALIANLCLLALRLGVLFGMARAYPDRPWTYWLSPVCDVPVVAQLWASAVRRRHVWRGRALVTGAC